MCFIRKAVFVIFIRDTRKFFFSHRVVGRWNRPRPNLDQEMVDAPSAKAFKGRL